MPPACRPWRRSGPSRGRLAPTAPALPRGTTRAPAGAPRPSLDRGPAELLELLLERVAQRLQELARRPRLLLVDLGHAEADVDQDPVAHLHGVGALGEQPHVDVAPDAGDLRLGDVVLLVDELHDL